MANRYYTISQVASRLGIKFYRLKYAHMAGFIPEPVRIGGIRLYDEEDVRRLEDYFLRKDGHGNIQPQQQELQDLAEF